jgi:hypothetical protein
MEEQGDQFKVVFAWLLLESAWKQGGRGSEEGAATHAHLSSYVVLVTKLNKDDFALVSPFLHGYIQT